MSGSDGGPAFPAGYTLPTPEEEGMTLRDWFAGQARIGPEEARDTAVAENLSIYEAVAKIAYRVADAMLAERGADG